MGKVLKNITTFSLWLAMLIIIAHQFIPHDHHFGHLYPEKGEACSTPDNTSKLPSHCHAFNNLTIEKKAVTVISTIHVFTVYFIDIKVFNSITPGLVVAKNCFADLQELLIKIDFLKLSSLRAPPAIA